MPPSLPPFFTENWPFFCLNEPFLVPNLFIELYDHIDIPLGYQLLITGNM